MQAPVETQGPDITVDHRGIDTTDPRKGAVIHWEGPNGPTITFIMRRIKREDNITHISCQ